MTTTMASLVVVSSARMRRSSSARAVRVDDVGEVVDRAGERRQRLGERGSACQEQRQRDESHAREPHRARQRIDERPEVLGRGEIFREPPDELTRAVRRGLERQHGLDEIGGQAEPPARKGDDLVEAVHARVFEMRDVDRADAAAARRIGRSSAARSSACPAGVEPALPEMDQQPACLDLARAPDVLVANRDAGERIAADDDRVLVEDGRVLEREGVERSPELVGRQDERRLQALAVPRHRRAWRTRRDRRRQSSSRTPGWWRARARPARRADRRRCAGDPPRARRTRGAMPSRARAASSVPPFYRVARAARRAGAPR